MSNSCVLASASKLTNFRKSFTSVLIIKFFNHQYVGSKFVHFPFSLHSSLFSPYIYILWFDACSVEDSKVGF